MLLWPSAAKQGFQDSSRLAYKQAQELGGQVREAGDGEIEKSPRLKNVTVCNVGQIFNTLLSMQFRVIQLVMVYLKSV
jgi:antirestriction protein ArdC